MHVVMLLTNPFRPDPRVLKEATSLINAGYRTTVVCWDRQGQYTAEEIINGIQVKRIALPSGYAMGSRQILHLPRFWQSAYRTIQHLKPDIIHCHDLDTTPIGYIYAQRHKIPWIFDAHERYPEQMQQQVNWTIYKLLLQLERYMVRNATITITVGGLLADYLKGYGGKVVVVGNYFPIEETHRSSTITRSNIEISNEEFVVSYIGGFSHARALHPYIQSADFYKEPLLLLAGDGSQRSSLLKEISTRSRVRYLGWIPQNLVLDYFKLSDVIYYGLYATNKNSLYSSPNSLYLAMATGKPIITNNIGQIAEVTRQERCGIVIEELSPEEIAKAIQKLSDASLREEMGTNGRRAAELKYNWQSAEAELLRAYRELAS